MTELENKVHQIDKRQDVFETYMKQRQDSFEDFVKANLIDNRERMNKYEEDMREFKKETNERFDKLETKIDSINKSVHNITLTAMIGIGAMAISVILFVGSVIYRG